MNNNPSKEEIINKAIKFHQKGNILEATKYYKYLINQGIKDRRVFCNYGLILLNLGKFQEAELTYRKAITLDPNHANSYLNLGGILRNLGKFQEAEFTTRKAIKLDLNLVQAYFNLGDILIILGKFQEAELNYLKVIELNPDFVKAYYYLSKLKQSNDKKIWEKQLFSKNILNNKSIEDKVYIYFARANILHKAKKYLKSSESLHLANKLKLFLNPSKCNLLIKKSRFLQIKLDEKNKNKKDYVNYPQSIFIVGMPRSGSTLVESILSMNSNVNDLGEINILEESFLEWQKTEDKDDFSELYRKKIKNKNNLSKISTNKWLYNYQYTGVIAQHIPNAKIIHCFRNPLDNILSIYRANFAKGNTYASSLVDCAKVYLDQEKLMRKYKKIFKEKIHNLNYDSLVQNPNKEIKSLISWLGWEWEDLYLSSHLNLRTVSTRSSIEVRSPINSKSLDGWKNYKEMLKPAMEIITQENKYKNLKY
tara:strand:+ start:163 stop:1599 length:1437 start_codon:yes stop_codon:yes gene_type:complete